MTCKDCYLEVVCKYVLKTDKVCSAKDCKEFKDKSKIIELPCKVGEKVYFLDPHICKKSINGDCTFACDGFDLDCAEYNGDIDIGEIEFDVEMLPEIGKTLFLTKAAAEQMIKEYKLNDTTKGD